MVLDETMPMLKGVYALNKQSVADEVDEESLHEILVSYLLVFRQGMSRNLTDFSFHEKLKAIVRNDTEAWDSLIAYERKAVHPASRSVSSEARGLRSSPDGRLQRLYAFPAAAEIVRTLA